MHRSIIFEVINQWEKNFLPLNQEYKCSSTHALPDHVNKPLIELASYKRCNVCNTTGPLDNKSSQISSLD